MGKFKELVLEIRQMDFDGFTPKQIANAVGLSEYQIIEIIDDEFLDANDEIEDPYRWADISADMDAEHYGNML